MKRFAIILVSAVFLSGCADLFYQPQRAKEWPDLGCILPLSLSQARTALLSGAILSFAPYGPSRRQRLERLSLAMC